MVHWASTPFLRVQAMAPVAVVAVRGTAAGQEKYPSGVEGREVHAEVQAGATASRAIPRQKERETSTEAQGARPCS